MSGCIEQLQRSRNIGRQDFCYEDYFAGDKIEDAKVLRNAFLEPTNSFKNLKFRRANLGVEGLQILSEAIGGPGWKVELVSFQVLHLEGEDIKAIGRFMNHPSAKFTSLQFELCTFSEPAATVIHDIVAQSGIEDLVLFLCKLTPAFCCEIVKACSEPTNRLKSISFYQNFGGDETANALEHALRNPHCKLVRINLEKNGVTAEAVARSLPTIQRSLIRDYSVTSDEIPPALMRKLHDLNHITAVPWYKKMILLLGVRQLRNFAERSPFRLIPPEVIRSWIAPTLPVETLRWLIEHRDDYEN